MRKQITVFVAISCLLSLQLRDLTTQLIFQIQQSSLTETICINRNTPELDCHARCQLNEKLDQIHAPEDPIGQASAPELERSVFYPLFDIQPQKEITNFKRSSSFFYLEMQSAFEPEHPNPPPQLA